MAEWERLEGAAAQVQRTQQRLELYRRGSHVTQPGRRRKQGASRAQYASSKGKSRTAGAAIATPKERQFIKACAEGNTRVVEQTLFPGSNVSPNARDKFNRTGLMYAILNGHGRVLDRLLSLEDLAVDAADSAGDTAIHFAVRAGNITVLRRILRLRGSPNVPNRLGSTPLHLAVESGKPELVAVLLKDAHGLAVDLRGPDGMTPVHQAILAGQPDLLALLLRRSVQPMTPFGEGNVPPLHLAVSADSASCLTLLLEGVASATTARDRLGRTALHVAVMEDRPAMVSMLVDRSADMLARDHLGRTPLHWACLLGRPECGQLVCSEGALGAVDDSGSTPLFLAAEAGRETMVGWMLDKGANPSAAASDGRLPLHAAAASGSVQCFGLLQDAFAGLSSADSEGCSALHYAAYGGHVGVLTAILSAKGGAETLNSSDSAGETALIKAVQADSLDSVALLLERGEWD